jgi:peptide/nickel transport system permease protein
MVRFILKRLGQALIALWLITVLVFLLGQVLPSDPGRSVLGNLASESTVRAYDHMHGLDKPVLTQYWNWLSNFPGTSTQYQAPIGPILTAALGRSIKLAVFAFVLVVPIGVLGGIASALRQGKLLDRNITLFGQAALTIPEFVSGIILIVVFGVELGWLPVSATPPAGSGFFTSLKYLILPVIPLVLILFGYIARMARVGTIEALESDYARTAILKGLPRGVVIRRHVLRNSLLPTITVIATQTGYLIGGLIVIETLFRYNGIGQLTYQAASTNHDIPMLEACVLTIGAVYLVVTLVADILFSILNPRIRLRAAE